jgi:hypothetical protein
MRHKNSPDDKPLTPAEARQKLQQGLEDYLAGKGPGTISFRLKRSKRASYLYPLKLTQQQRESLLEFTKVSGKLKKKIEQAGEGIQIVPVTWNELSTLNDVIGQAAHYAPSPHKKRLYSVMDKVVNFFEEEHAEVFRPETKQPRRKRQTKSDRLFQFKITLLDIKPAIWRRIQIHDCTLPEFHEYIQAAFGWWNYHLHQFEIAGLTFMEPDPDGDDWGMEFEDERETCSSANWCRSPASALDGFTSTTWATVGGTRFCLRASRRLIQKQNIRFASKVLGPAHQRIAAAGRDTSITWKRSPTPSIQSTERCFSGLARSIPKCSMPRRRRGRLGR